MWMAFETEIETFMSQQNMLQLIKYNQSYDEEHTFSHFEYILRERVNRRRGQYYIFIGADLTGKSTQAQNMAQTFGYELIDWETLPDTIKELKSTEDEPYDHVTWEDIIEYFQN